MTEHDFVDGVVPAARRGRAAGAAGSCPLLESFHRALLARGPDHEWHARIPDYRVADGAVLENRVGGVGGLRGLPLQWDVEIPERTHA